MEPQDEQAAKKAQRIASTEKICEHICDDMWWLNVVDIYIYTRIWYLHWYAWIYMYNKYTGVYTYRSMCGYMRSSSFSFLQGISNLQRSWGRVSQISRTGFFFLHLFHFRRVWTLPWNTFVKQKNTTSLKLLNPLWNYQQFRLWKYQNCPNIRAISSNPTNPFVSGFFFLAGSDSFTPGLSGISFNSRLPGRVKVVQKYELVQKKRHPRPIIPRLKRLTWLHQGLHCHRGVF